MKELTLTIGLPRSGKSTWSKMHGHPIVSPDSIRLALHGEAYNVDAEPMVWVIAKYMVKSLFIAGHDKVILDATNTTKSRRDFWINDMWEIKHYYFTTSKEVCIQRAKDSNTEYLIPVIERMSEKLDLTDVDLTEFDLDI